MNKIFLSLFLVISLISTAWANNGWYSTLQGAASDVEQTSPPNGVTIAYNTTDHQWEFNYGLAPAGGTTGTCLEKNSNSDYDYSWVTCSGSGGGSGNVGIGTIGQDAVYVGTTTVGSGIITESNGNMGVGTVTPTNTLYVNGNETAYDYHTPNTNAHTTTQNGIFLDGNGKGWLLAVEPNGTSNVGIGTMFPGQLLDVAGTVRMTSFNMPTNASNTYVLTSDGSGNGTWQAAGAGSNYFTNSGASTYLSTGTNLGVGSTNPGQTLDVQGSLRINGSTSNFIGPNAGNVNDGVVVCGNSTTAGSAVPTGTTPSFTYQTAGKIVSATISGSLSAGTCSCTIDVWKTNAALPTVSNTITASALPTLSSATYNQNTTLSGWTTTIAKNDVIMCNVQSCTCDNWNLVLGVND